MVEGIIEEAKQFIKIFPNPAVSALNLVSEGTFNYEIYDMVKKMVKQ